MDQSEISKLVRDQFGELRSELTKWQGDALEQIAKSQPVRDVFASVSSDVREKIAAIMAQLPEFEKTQKADRTELATAIERLNGLAQKVGAQQPDPQPAAKQQTLGQRFLAEVGAEIGKVASRERQSVAANIKLISTGIGTANSLITPFRLPGIITPATFPLTVRDLIGTTETTQGVIEFVKENVFTNAAAPVVEGAQKPESNLTFVVDSEVVQTIAHWILVTRQALQDVPQLEGYIDNRLTYGLQLEVEEQLLLGDGVAPNLQGLIPLATAGAANVAGQNRVDVLTLALAQVYLATGYRPDGMVLNAGDAARIMTTKDSTGQYLFGNPLNTLGIFGGFSGIRIAWSPVITVNTWLVGAFGPGAQIFEREGITIMASSEDRDNFIKNLVTILAETRLTLVTFVPGAFVKGNFTIP